MQIKRISELDLLRGIAILGVLVLHSSFASRFSTQTMAVQAVLARVFDWAVLAFFFSSGCLHQRAVTFRANLKKRAITLLLPFFLYNALYNLSFVASDALGWAPQAKVEVDLGLFVTGFFWSPGFQLYFLPYLFAISVVISGANKLSQPRNRCLGLAVLLLVLVFYLYRGYPEVSHGPELEKLPVYLAAFLIGLVWWPFCEQTCGRTWLFLAALVVVICLVVIFRFRAVSLFVPPLVVGVAASFRKVGQPKVLLFLGTLSGSIYLWHTPIVLPAITRLLAYIGTPSLFNCFGSIGLTLLVCVVLRVGLDALFLRVTKSPAPRYVTL